MQETQASLVKEKDVIESTRQKRKGSAPAKGEALEKMDDPEEVQPKSVRRNRKSQATAHEEDAEE